MSLVTCARVGDALTEWLDTASQLKLDALCEALGCGPTTEEIAAVFMNCAGVAHIPGESIPSCDEMDAAITAAVGTIFAGGTGGQVWTKFTDGTQGWADAEANVTTGDTDSVAFSGAGTPGNPLTASTSVSTDPDNALVVQSPGGVFSNTTNMSWDNVAKTITYVNNKGDSVTIDLSQFEVDLHVDNATFDPATTLLTLDVAGGTPVIVDLGALAAISTTGSATVALSGDGTAATPLQAVVNIDPVATNRVSATASGILVTSELPAGGTAGQVLTANAGGGPVWAAPGLASVASTDTSTIAFGGTGTTADPLTAATVLDPTAGNRITATATGLRVEAELPSTVAADAGKHLVVDATGTPVWQDEEPCHVQTVAGTGTLVVDDNGKLVLGSGGTKTAPNTLPIGFRVDLVGPVTIAVSGGATLRSVDGLSTVVTDAGATLIKITATEFWLAGALE